MNKIEKVGEKAYFSMPFMPPFPDEYKETFPEI